MSIEALDNVIREFETLDERFHDTAGEIRAKAESVLAAVFEAYPQVNSISWMDSFGDSPPSFDVDGEDDEELDDILHLTLGAAVTRTIGRRGTIYRDGTFEANFPEFILDYPVAHFTRRKEPVEGE